MKKTLFIVSLGLSIACAGFQEAAKKIPNVIISKNKVSQKKTDTIKMAVSSPVKKEYQDTAIKKILDTVPKKTIVKKTPKVISKVLTHYKWNRLLEKHVSSNGTIN